VLCCSNFIKLGYEFLLLRVRCRKFKYNSFDIVNIYYPLLKFILDLIKSILSNPSFLKCNLDFIKIAASLKSLKSLALIPCILYSSKKGIIFSVISDKLLIADLTIPDFSTILKETQPKICEKPANK
jgi:hypothetical protein